jgi:hypothetical protein
LWQIFIHVRSLDGSHFGVVEVMGLTIMASRPPSMELPFYWISLKILQISSKFNTEERHIGWWSHEPAVSFRMESYLKIAYFEHACNYVQKLCTKKDCSQLIMQQPVTRETHLPTSTLSCT